MTLKSHHHLSLPTSGKIWSGRVNTRPALCRALFKERQGNNMYNEFEQAAKLAKIQADMTMQILDGSMEEFFESVFNEEEHSIEDIFAHGFKAGVVAAITVMTITREEEKKAEQEEGGYHDGK